jgi:hypothetical protein
MHSQSPPKIETNRENKRRRSLCDGGGRGSVLAKTPEKVLRALKISEITAPQINQSPQTHRRLVCLGGGGDEPM